MVTLLIINFKLLIINGLWCIWVGWWAGLCEIGVGDARFGAFLGEE